METLKEVLKEFHKDMKDVKRLDGLEGNKLLSGILISNTLILKTNLEVRDLLVDIKKLWEK